MNYLLDTHILLWSLTDDQRLSQATHGYLTDQRNQIFVSVVSAWEISIKRSLGKLQAPNDLERAIAEVGFQSLRLEFSTIPLIEELPQLHRDPFDRMLIAQSLDQNLTLMTADQLIRQYETPVHWCG